MSEETTVADAEQERDTLEKYFRVLDALKTLTKIDDLKTITHFAVLLEDEGFLSLVPPAAEAAEAPPPAWEPYTYWILGNRFVGQSVEYRTTGQNLYQGPQEGVLTLRAATHNMTTIRDLAAEQKAKIEEGVRAAIKTSPHFSRLQKIFDDSTQLFEMRAKLSTDADALEKEKTDLSTTNGSTSMEELVKSRGKIQARLNAVEAELTAVSDLLEGLYDEKDEALTSLKRTAAAAWTVGVQGLLSKLEEGKKTQLAIFQNQETQEKLSHLAALFEASSGLIHDTIPDRAASHGTRFVSQLLPHLDAMPLFASTQIPAQAGVQITGLPGQGPTFIISPPRQEGIDQQSVQVVKHGKAENVSS